MWTRPVTFSQVGRPLGVVLATSLFFCCNWGSCVAFRASSTQRQLYLSPPQRQLPAGYRQVNMSGATQRLPKADGALVTEDDRPGAFGLKAQYTLLQRILADNRRARSSPPADEHQPLLAQVLNDLDQGAPLQTPSDGQQTRLNKAIFIK